MTGTGLFYSTDSVFEDGTTTYYVRGYDVTGSTAPQSPSYEYTSNNSDIVGTPNVMTIDSDNHIYTFEGGDRYAAAGYDEQFNEKWEAATTAEPAGPEQQGGIAVSDEYVIYVWSQQDFADISIVNKDTGNIRTEVIGWFAPVVSNPIPALNKDTFYVGYLNGSGQISVREYDYDLNQVNSQESTVSLENERNSNHQLQAAHRGDLPGVAVSCTYTGDGGFSAENGWACVGFDGSLSIVGDFTETTSQSATKANNLVADEDYIYSINPISYGAYKIDKDFSNTQKKVNGGAYAGPSEAVDGDYFIVSTPDSDYQKIDKSTLETIWLTSHNEYLSLGATFPRVGTGAWGPSITQVTATQIAALADVPVADVLEILNATQPGATASMSVTELVELIDAVGSDVTATMGSPALTELIASTQVTGQATVLDGSLNVSLSSSPVAAASTMEDGSVNLSLASAQAQATAGVNTVALSELIDAVQSPAEASVFTGTVGMSLRSAQVDSTATVNDTELFLALTSAQSDVSSTMLQGDVSPIELLQAAQYAAQSDMSDTRLDALLGATQPQTQAAMNTIESLDEAIGAFQTNVDAEMSQVAINLVAVDAAQIDSLATVEDAEPGFFIEVDTVPTSAQADSDEAEVALALVVTAEPTSAVAVIPVRGRFNPRRVDVSASGEDELNDAELTSGRNNWVSND